MTSQGLYAEYIQPLHVKTCGNCHGTVPKDNDLELTGFTAAGDVRAKPAVLAPVAQRLHIGDMLPREAPQPNVLDGACRHVGFADGRRFPDGAVAGESRSDKSREAMATGDVEGGRSVQETHPGQLHQG